MDYEPLPLTPHLNAGQEIYDLHETDPVSARFAKRGEFPSGHQLFQGLPFQVGAPDEDGPPYVIGFGAAEGLHRGPLQIAVGKRARSVLFAHAMLETALWEGGELGARAATYRFVYADGDAVEVPIRERFEIAVFPFAYGQKPYLCVSDTGERLYDRYHGRWDQAGFRHTEVTWSPPRAFYIWPWVNAHPDRAIRHIEIHPGPFTFVIGAVTLGHAEEFPLVRSARRPLRIRLPDTLDPKQQERLSLEIDRGLAGYLTPLPADWPDRSGGGLQGFGLEMDESSDSFYTHAAANPSATLELKAGGETIAAANWGRLAADGAANNAGVRFETLGAEKNWVRVRVLDGETGRPLPCRIAFLSRDGVPYPPHGHHAPVFSNQDTWNNDVGGDVRLGQLSYAYIDGRCEGWLPRGRVWVDAACGFEYRPLRAWVDIEPQQQELTLRLSRTADMNAARWFSGDSHVHFLSSQGASLEAAGEGLNVVNLLVSQWGHHFSNIEEFTGREIRSEDGRTIVSVSQENRQHMFGHLSLLGLKEPVLPLASGGPSEAELGGGLDVTLSDWADRCRAQGGTVVIPHLGITNGENAALIATGRADAAEMLFHAEYFHREYYRYLNSGYRLPLVGGTDKMDAAVPVGLYRTYVYIPEDVPFSYENWSAGVRAGRTFLSGGPLLSFKVDGQLPGSLLSVPGGGVVEIEAEVRSIFPVHSLQIIEQGRVVAETEAPAGAGELRLSHRFDVSGDTWLAARCAGPKYTAVPHLDSWSRGIMAHTSPVYIACGEGYELYSRTGTQYMLTAVEGGLSYIRQMSRQYHPGDVRYPHGEADHQAYLERPYLEARAALHRRMHELGVRH